MENEFKLRNKITDWIEEHFEPTPGKIKKGWADRINFPMCMQGIDENESLSNYEAFQSEYHKYERTMNQRGFVMGGDSSHPCNYFIAKDAYEAVIIAWARINNMIGYMNSQNAKMEATKETFICDFPTLKEEIKNAYNVKSILERHMKLLKKNKGKKRGRVGE